MREEPQFGCVNPAGIAAHQVQFRVGDVSVQVAGEDASDVALVSSLSRFREGTGTAHIRIQIKRAARLPGTEGRELFDSGSVWRLFEDDAGFRFDFATATMGDTPYKRLIVDREFRRASLLIKDRCFAGTCSAAPLEYPLDELLIMHRLTQEKAIELHGCGIVRADGIGNLFVGHSGAGKSTTTRLWTAREDVEVLSDDRIIVRREKEPRVGSVSEIPVNAAGAASKPEVPRLREQCAARTAHYARDDKKIRMYGTPWHGEAMYASPNSAPLARIFILEHGHGNVITPLSPSQAVAELFARAFVPFHQHEYVESALTFLEEVAESIPVYRYSFEPDQRAVDAILHFHD